MANSHFEILDLGKLKNSRQRFSIKTVIMLAIRQTLELNDHQLNAMRFSELHHIYQQQHRRLKAIDKSKAGNDYSDTLNNYTQLQTELMLNNAYTPAQSSQSVDEIITYTSSYYPGIDSQEFSDPAIINRRLIRVYDQAAQQLTLSGFITVPLMDLNVKYTDPNYIASVKHANVIASTVFGFKLRISHMESDDLYALFDYIDALRASDPLNNTSFEDFATAEITPIATFGANGIIGYQPQENIAELAKIQNYLAQFNNQELIHELTQQPILDALHVALSDRRQQSLAMIRQVNQTAVGITNSEWTAEIGAKLNQLIVPGVLDEPQTDRLQHALGKLLNGFVISKELDECDAKIMTRQELFSYCVQSTSMSKLIKFPSVKYIQRNYLIDQPLQLTNMEIIPSQNEERVQRLLTAFNHQQFTDSVILTYDTSQAEYHQPLVFQQSAWLKTTNRIYSRIGFCITDSRNRWIYPIVIDYSIRRHVRDFVSPMLITEQTAFNFAGKIVPSVNQQRPTDIADQLQLIVADQRLSQRQQRQIKFALARLMIKLQNQSITLRTTSDKYHQAFNCFFDAD